MILFFDETEKKAVVKASLQHLNERRRTEGKPGR